MGYTDVHYAVKDAYSLTGVLITIAFFTFVAILFIPVTIVVLLVWLTVRLVQRHKAQPLDTASPATAIPTGTESPGVHVVADAVPYRVSGPDRGAGCVDLYCFNCMCGEVLVGTTPGQARSELREHLHESIEWANVDQTSRSPSDREVTLRPAPSTRAGNRSKHADDFL